MLFRIHAFQGENFFLVQVFQGRGFFWLQVFQSSGFSGSRFFRVQVQGLGPGFRRSQIYRLINLIQSKVERKPQQYARQQKKRPPKFSFFKFHLDNLILAAVELKKTKQTKMINIKQSSKTFQRQGVAIPDFGDLNVKLFTLNKKQSLHYKQL